MNRKGLRQRVSPIAERVIRERGLNSLPVDPIAIARSLDFEVTEMPSEGPGVSGMLLRHGNRFAIAYSTFVKSIGFRNFSVAHELGHDYLPGQIDAVLSADDTHEPRGVSLG